MAKREPGRPVGTKTGRTKINKSFTISVKNFERMALIAGTYKNMYRIKSLMIDVGLEISLGIIEKNGPAWFIENRDSIIEYAVDANAR